MVLHRAEHWALGRVGKRWLSKASASAHAQLTALIALVAKAGPFSTQMQAARRFADSAKYDGQKPH